MSKDAYLDPELKPVLEMAPTFELTLDTLPGIRSQMAAAFAAAPPPVVRAHMETFTIPGPVGAPAVRVVSYRPEGSGTRMPAMLHIHGGGYVLGSPAMSDADNHWLARELGCRVISVDYRLAPETPFPGPLEDCYAALLWLHAQADTLHVDPRRIGVKGESAGGGLAATLALLARDRRGPALAFQHLIYPMLDDRTCVRADPHPFTGQYMWTPAYNQFGWSSYLGQTPGGEGIRSHAAAARADDLAGLPPTFIAVGGLDLLLDENLEYARRLSRAGVPVEFHLYPGAYHGFEMAQDSRVAKTAEHNSREVLRRSFEK